MDERESGSAYVQNIPMRTSAVNPQSSKGPENTSSSLDFLRPQANTLSRSKPRQLPRVLAEEPQDNPSFLDAFAFQDQSRSQLPSETQQNSSLQIVRGFTKNLIEEPAREREQDPDRLLLRRFSMDPEN